jgi:hypothetical protein
LVHATIFYCLRFETSHFVASYDSQGHGGGIRPRLHMVFRKRLSSFPYNPSARIPWKTPSYIVKEACLLVRYLAIDVFLLWRRHVLRECLPTRCLAMGIQVTILSNEGTSDVLYNFVSHCCSNRLCWAKNVGTQHEPRDSNRQRNFVTLRWVVRVLKECMQNSE